MVDERGRRLIDDVVGPRREAQLALMAASDPDPMPVAKADLLYLWDDYGAEHLDFAAAMHPLGHRHQPIYDLLVEHMRYYGSTGPAGRHLERWPVELVRKLSAMFTGPDEEPRRVLLCEGERDAVRQAVQLASTRRCAVVGTLDGCWHDWLLDDPVWNDLFEPDGLDMVNWDHFGAVLLTAVDRAHAPVPFLRDWVLAARGNGATVVFDESVTGFGRTGVWWAQEHTGLVADLTVVGGPVGGGLPLGAVVGPERLLGCARDPSPHSGHPWACAAGFVTLDTINPAMLTHADDCGREVGAALAALCQQFPEHLSGHHGVGLLRGLRFRDHDLAAGFPRLARDRGLHLAPAVDGTVPIAPVLVSSPNEMRRGVDLIADTLLAWDDDHNPGRTAGEGH